MRSFLFVNPASGRYSRRRINDIVDSLKDSGLAPTLFSVTNPSEALPCCCVINECPDRPLIIVAAGDGTLNAVVNGLQPGTATLAVLPLGTSNVLAAELGIGSVDEGLKRIAAETTRQLSVGVLQLERTSHRFVLMAGIGFDGAAVRDVWPLGKRFLKQGAYALSALRNCLAWDRRPLGLASPTRAVDCHGIVVCNASRYGGNFVLAPEGNPFSAELTAVCIRGNDRRAYLRIARDLFLGRAGTSRELVRFSADSFEIKGTRPIQVDGDFVGYSPAKLSVVSDFARIIV